MHRPNTVEFMGVLVDRQYTPSQKYAQLVFETAEGIRLSLSRNISLARSLRLGMTYAVKGPEHTVGQKRFIREPTTTLVAAHKAPSLIKRYKVLITAIFSLIVILFGAGAFAYAAYSNDGQTASQSKGSATKSVSENSAPVSVSTNTQPTSTNAVSSSQQQSVPASTPASKKKVNPVSPSTATKNPTTNSTLVTPVTNDETSPQISQDPVETTPATNPIEQAPVDSQTPIEQAYDPVETP